MKVRIEMDMTPEEARAFMGLPDVAPLQQKMLEEMQSRMPFMGYGLGGNAGQGAETFQKFQKFFWDSATLAAGKKVSR